MDQNLMKSLVDLIDETIGEIEQLKKSDRFSAAELEMPKAGDSITGADANGKMVKEEKDEEDEEEEKKKKEFAAKDHGHKVECEVKKEEKDDDKDEDDKEEKEEEVKKSEEVDNNLMKSMVEARVKPLEDKINTLIDLVKSFADAPRAQKSVSYNSVTPLAKSENTEVLSKSAVVDKLLDLKKSGTPVDSADVAMAEMSRNDDTLKHIVAKYNIQ